MGKMKAAVITEPKGPIQVVERDVLQPGASQELVKVQACVSATAMRSPRDCGQGCSICGWQATKSPASLTPWGRGLKVGRPAPAWAWAGTAAIAGTVRPAVPVTSLFASNNSGARAGDLVAIHGIGGLGRLGVQYAAKMGFRTVAIARGKDKEPLARQLGAHNYIDRTAGDPAAALQAMGGARVILATATSGDGMSAVFPAGAQRETAGRRSCHGACAGAYRRNDH